MSIFNHFQHLNLSNDQQTALQKIEDFLESETQVFMLKGYAGSGKTTVLKGLVEYLAAQEKDFALMAPTGRAAKVIREKTGQEAWTIHKSIYSYDELEEVEITNEENGVSFCYYFKIRNNTEGLNTVYIVDEASMVSDEKSEGEFFRFGTGHLLSDLITFSQVNSITSKAKIIFVGDPCQLAPITDPISKALDPQYLEETFGLSVEEAELKQVLRQNGESEILKAATKIRRSISSGFFNDFNLQENGQDIFNPTYETFLSTYFTTQGPKVIVAYKNKTCLNLNQQIRKHLFGTSDLPVQPGDIVILGANNSRKNIFNGEFAVVNNASPTTISRDITFYPANKNTKYPQNPGGTITVTLTWRHVELLFPDAESSNKTVSGLMLENFLSGDNFLTPEETQALYVDFRNRNPKLKPKTEEFKEAIINDEFFNCLKVKYGYAVTCHKAQGGEWENVFTIWDHDNRDNFNCYKDSQLRTGKANETFYRWAYTAVTRASKTLFAVNPPRFNSYSSLTIMEVQVVNALQQLAGTAAETEAIEVDQEILSELEKFRIADQPLQVQDHFIRVRQALQSHYIDITGWKRNGYEIWYIGQREGKTAGLKTFINKDLIFNAKYGQLPAHTNDMEFYRSAEAILLKMPAASVKRNTTETILPRLEFEFEQEEKFPFTRTLFEDLEATLQGTGIQIDNIEHQQYKERYTFLRNNEKVLIDFEYNSAGFFGRVVPIQKGINSPLLVEDIFKAIQTLKQEEYAN